MARARGLLRDRRPPDGGAGGGASPPPLPIGVVFGGNGMQPADVVRALAASAAFRLAFLATTGLIAAPVIGPALLAPGALFVRSLPVRRSALVGLVAAAAALVEVPVFFLFVAARAPVAGIAFGCAAAALALLLGTRATTPIAVAASASSSVALVAGLPAALAAPVAVAALGLVAREAWVHAPERAGHSAGAVALVRGGPARAVAAVHALRLLRREAPALVRGALFALGAGILIPIVAANRGAVGAGPSLVVLLVVATLPVVVALSGVCASILDNERSLRWLLDATGATRAARHGGAAAALGGLGGAAGAIVALGAGALGKWPWATAARCGAGSFVWGGARGHALHAWGRLALRDGPNDHTRFVVGAAALGGGALTLASMLGEAAAYGALGASALATLVLGLREPLGARA